MSHNYETYYSNLVADPKNVYEIPYFKLSKCYNWNNLDVIDIFNVILNFELWKSMYHNTRTCLRLENQRKVNQKVQRNKHFRFYIVILQNLVLVQ